MRNQYPHEQTIQWVNQLLNGTISSPDFAELASILEQEPAARLIYVEHLSLHHELKRNFALRGSDEIASLTSELEDLLTRPDRTTTTQMSSGVFQTQPRSGSKFNVLASSAGPLRPIVGWLPAICSVILLVIGIGVVAYQRALPVKNDLAVAVTNPNRDLLKQLSAELEAEKNAVAILTKDVEAKWATGSTAYPQGQSISSGVLDLATGIVQVDFFCGATMILEGPAKFEIKDETAGFIHYGKLRAFVPDRAKGFVISSPRCEVLDLGTEFAMEVGEDADSEVHVIEGEVRIKNLGDVGTEGQLVTKGKAVRFAGTGPFLDIESRQNQFVGPEELDRISNASRNVGFERWQTAMESVNRDGSLLALYMFQDSSHWDRVLLNSRPGDEKTGEGAIVGCRWAEGRWPSKRALQFSRSSHRVRLDIPGQHDAITLSTWVNLAAIGRDMALCHPDTDQPNYLHWTVDASPAGDSANFHLAVSDTVDGQQIREHYNSGPGCFFLSDIYQWTHVAVTYDPIAKVVVHYKNGEEVGRSAIERVQPIGLGVCNLGNWPYKQWAKGTEFEIRNLNGLMDEFAAFSRVLSAEEIKQFYESGKPEN